MLAWEGASAAQAKNSGPCRWGCIIALHGRGPHCADKMTDRPPRYTTTRARIALAARFNLPYDDSDQDWEYQIADAARFREFSADYASAELTEDERISLMEILVQCVDNMAPGPEHESAWLAIRPHLLAQASLHWTTVEYWSLLDQPDLEADGLFAVSEKMRDVWREINPG